MKRKRLDNDALVKAIINKQLEPYNITFEDIKDVPNWVDIYTTTREKEDKWIKWGIEFIVKNAKNPILQQKHWATREMSWLCLGYGLKIKKDEE